MRARHDRPRRAARGHTSGRALRMTQALARILSVLALIAVLLTSGTTADATGTAGAVYTLTNAASGNAVVAFSRSASGAFATGGLGGGSGLGSQDAVITSDDGQWLYAVDAGSNDIATFRIRHDGLGLVGRTPSGGMRPISLTTNGNLVYVLNAVSN